MFAFFREHDFNLSNMFGVTFKGLALSLAAEESCMLVGSRKPLFFFYNGREPAHRSPVNFNIIIPREAPSEVSL